jgi:hypothetical protein
MSAWKLAARKSSGSRRAAVLTLLCALAAEWKAPDYLGVTRSVARGIP